MKLLLCLLTILLLIASLFAPLAAAAPSIDKQAVDEREIKLTRFFDHYKCPKPYYVHEYIGAADRYQLPYTLLPTISVQESSCGRHYRYNNFWGWNSARSGFASVAAGIEFVSAQLSTGKYYRGKPVAGKLHTYNPSPTYPPKIQKLMYAIEHNN